MAEAIDYTYEVDNMPSSMNSDLTISPNRPLNRQFLDKIEAIEPKLKIYEVVSILFLLHENAERAFNELSTYLNGKESSLISKWYKEVDDGKKTQWEKRFPQSLFLIKNYKLLSEFGIDTVSAEHDFCHTDNYFDIPNIRVILYHVCENLVGEDLKNLLERMGEKNLKYKDYLEVFFLKWIYEGKLCIENEKVDVGLLLDNLDALGKAELLNGLSKQSLSETHEKFDSEYPIMDPDNVGFCIIINQKNFRRDNENPALQLKRREGTEKDCNALKHLLKELKFDYVIVDDVMSTHIIGEIVNKIGTSFKANHSVFMLIILSHGSKGVIYGTDSKPVQIHNIDRCLLQPQLKDKPKIIVIQACQGNSFVKAPNIETDAPAAHWPCDTVFCMATIPYFVSYRHLEKGAWYIQTFCEILLENRKEEFICILRKLQRKLYNTPVFGTEERIRLFPEFTSRLQKELYLMKIK